MKSLRLAALLIAGLFASNAIAAGNIEAGKTKSATCAACHSVDGNSPSSAFPKIAGQGAPYMVKQLKDYKAGVREDATMFGMTAALSEQDMEDLAAYFASQTIKVGAADPELVEEGERLYRGGNIETGIAACAACHGPAGEGITAAKFPALGGQYAEYTELQLRAFRAAGRGDIDAPKYRRNDVEDPEALGMMQATAAKMTDREIKAVASYISGLSK
ncbi:MAG TPA: c-type cytochrome [Alcanivoracaceae bacterium]|nr:c-type cytochrome [Alcanivoracaceae bacterium]